MNNDSTEIYEQEYRQKKCATYGRQGLHYF